MTDLTDDQVRALADGYPPENDNLDWAERAQTLARALLAARAELARVKADAAAAVEALRKERDDALELAEERLRGQHRLSNQLNDTVRDLSDQLAAAAQQREAVAYRDGWRFAYQQCLATGSVPDPDYKGGATLTPTDPGDGWTWNERLGWIGPDGNPADPRGGEGDA